MSMPSADELRQAFSYDPETGELIRLSTGKPVVSINTAKGGKLYFKVKVLRRFLLVHRVIWKIMTGEDPPDQIDHINGDGMDNKWSNLRLATGSQNVANASSRGSNTGYRSVYLDKGRRKYVVRFTVNRKRVHVGSFNELEEAAKCAHSARIAIFGEFARDD